MDERFAVTFVKIVHSVVFVEFDTVTGVSVGISRCFGFRLFVISRSLINRRVITVGMIMIFIDEKAVEIHSDAITRNRRAFSFFTHGFVIAQAFQRTIDLFITDFWHSEIYPRTAVITEFDGRLKGNGVDKNQRIVFDVL